MSAGSRTRAFPCVSTWKSGTPAAVLTAAVFAQGAYLGNRDVPLSWQCGGSSGEALVESGAEWGAVYVVYQSARLTRDVASLKRQRRARGALGSPLKDIEAQGQSVEEANR
eukprot:5353324-Pyramimonas_sp.AAC.1